MKFIIVKIIYIYIYIYIYHYITDSIDYLKEIRRFLFPLGTPFFREPFNIVILISCVSVL